MFGHVIDFSVGSTGPAPGVSPVNGVTDWSIQWGAEVESPVTVTIDGQSFEGNGVWGTEECGTFVMQFSGTYVGSNDASHTFSAGGNFWYFDDQLEGALAWTETWAQVHEVGTMGAMDASVSGRRR